MSQNSLRLAALPSKNKKKCLDVGTYTYCQFPVLTITCEIGTGISVQNNKRGEPCDSPPFRLEKLAD